MHFRELGEDQVDVVEGVRTPRMARDLRHLPGRQVGEDARRELPALGLQSRDFVLQVDLGVGSHMLQLFDLRLKLGDRLLEIKETDGHLDPVAVKLTRQVSGQARVSASWPAGHTAVAGLPAPPAIQARPSGRASA